VNKLHNEISDGIEQSNINYKLRASIKTKFNTFNIGDYVIVRIRLKLFPLGSVKNLHTRSTGPF